MELLGYKLNSIDDLEKIDELRPVKWLVEQGEQFDDYIQEALLYISKGMFYYVELTSAKKVMWAPEVLKLWRQAGINIAFGKGVIRRELKKVEQEYEQLKSVLELDALRTVKKRGGRGGKDSVIAEVRRTSRKFCRLEREMSDLSAILEATDTLLYQFNLVKDIIIQESVNTRQHMDSSAPEHGGF